MKKTNNPANFRPITLQSAGLKIFTSCLRDSIFDFIKINGFVENKIQKGFTHKVSGTLEHTAMIGNIINKARIKQVFGDYSVGFKECVWGGAS